MKKIFLSGSVFVIIAALLWSLDGLLRISLYSLPPAVIVFYEHILGFVILLLLSFKWFRDLKKMSRKEWIAISVVAFFSGALGTIFYTSALKYVSYSQYSVVVLLQELQPIWAIAAAAILLRERITFKFFYYAALALIGAYLITFKNLYVNLATGSGTALAGVLALLAGFVWGSSTAISKYVLNKVSYLTATALRFMLAPVFAFLIIISSGEYHSLFSISSSNFYTLLLITFSTGMVALVFYYYGLKKTPASITTLCELVWPASAVFIDYFHFGKTLSISQALGIVILGYSLYNVTKGTWKKKQEHPIVIEEGASESA